LLASLRSYRPERRVFEYKLGFWISATMPNRTPLGRKAECISACHLAEKAINDEKTDAIKGTWGDLGRQMGNKIISLKWVACVGSESVRTTDVKTTIP
jgi:hypothetical protein